MLSLASLAHRYTDDISLPVGTLQGVLIHSTEAGCDLKSIDTTAASKMPGVHRVIVHADLEKLGGNNKLGPIVKDEEVFCTKRVKTVGQVLGVVCADTLEQAQMAAKAVKVEYVERARREADEVDPPPTNQPLARAGTRTSTPRAS